MELVAYIFAGSARSFIMPPVQAMLKTNLIEAFCPQDVCNYDIFVRISSNDNTHTGIDAQGTLARSSVSDREIIRDSLTFIEPAAWRSSHLFVNYYEIGSKEEDEAMKSFGRNDTRHKIYRELDSRRYSMYYGRWKAYEMMIEQEILQGRQYTWVVHGRLDAGWGSPVKPVTEFYPGKFYGPDLWYSEVPDTFAFMSRNLSDFYFSLDGLMHPSVLCLGGPNLNTNLLNPIQLAQNGYSEEEINLVIEEDCRRKFPTANIVTVAKQNLTWSFAGFSEAFLRRKMKVRGYDIMKGNILLVPFFSYLIRLPLKPMCFYLEPKFFISWLKTKQTVNSALFPGCVISNEDFQRFTSVDSPRCTSKTEYSGVMRSQSVTTTEKSCVLKKEYSDLNFLPFRIRSKQFCLTTSSTHSVNMTECINRIRKGRFMQQYAEEQLFYFYPLLNTPQKIRQLIPPLDKRLCVTADPSDVNGDLISIKMQNCDTTSDYKYPSNQMFTVERINITRLNQDPANRDSMNTGKYLKPLSGAILKWQMPQSNDMYCVYFGNSVQSLKIRSTLRNIYLKRCTVAHTSSISGNVLVLERTTTEKPYRPGITVGTYPTWADP